MDKNPYSDQALEYGRRVAVRLYHWMTLTDTDGVDVAKSLGLPPSVVSAVLKNRRPPSMLFIAGVCGMMGVDLAQLVAPLPDERPGDVDMALMAALDGERAVHSYLTLQFKERMAG